MPDQKKTKKDILNELESIKGLLLLNEDEVDIPVLEEIIASAAPSLNKDIPSDQAASEPINTTKNTNPELEKHQEKTEKQLDLITEKKENPFLPQHIRNKLRGNQTPEFTKRIENNDPTHITNLLVASIMPQLERLLRQRLSSLTKEQIDTLINTSTTKR